jgi:hypothetical protein
LVEQRSQQFIDSPFGEEQVVVGENCFLVVVDEGLVVVGELRVLLLVLGVQLLYFGS